MKREDENIEREREAAADAVILAVKIGEDLQARIDKALGVVSAWRDEGVLSQANADWIESALKG